MNIYMYIFIYIYTPDAPPEASLPPLLGERLPVRRIDNQAIPLT